MVRALRSKGILGRIRLALVIAVLFDIIVGVFAGVVYSAAPSSSIARMLDGLGAPVQSLTNWVAPGHTGTQPLLDMLFSFILSWSLIWICLSLPAWWTARQ
jgi:hypothetical protein